MSNTFVSTSPFVEGTFGGPVAVTDAEIPEPVTLVRVVPRRTERQMQEELSALMVVHGWQVTREYRTTSGTRVDLVALRPNHAPLVIECKLRLETPGLTSRAFCQLREQMTQIGRIEGSNKRPLGILVGDAINHENIAAVREDYLDLGMRSTRDMARWIRAL